MKLVMVEWVDSHFLPNEWCSRQKIEVIKRSPKVSFGVILAETDTEILICPNLDSECGAQGLTIPKCAIKGIRRLKVVSDESNSH